MTHYSINGVEGQRMYDGIPVYSPPYPLYTPRLSNLKNVKYDSSSMDVNYYIVGGLGNAMAGGWDRHNQPSGFTMQTADGTSRSPPSRIVHNQPRWPGDFPPTPMEQPSGFTRYQGSSSSGGSGMMMPLIAVIGVAVVGGLIYMGVSHSKREREFLASLTPAQKLEYKKEQEKTYRQRMLTDSIGSALGGGLDF